MHFSLTFKFVCATNEQSMQQNVQSATNIHLILRIHFNGKTFLLGSLMHLDLVLRQLFLISFQTLNTISAEKNSTIVFPLPIDLIMGFMKGLGRLGAGGE